MLKQVKTLIPPPLYKKVKEKYYDVRLSQAKRAFQNAADKPAYLKEELLPILHNNYKADEFLSYDPGSLLSRACERVNEIKQKMGTAFKQVQSALEIGCGDGMICAVLAADHNIHCCAVDISNEMFDERAMKSNVEFIHSNAENIPKPAESFDLVFSYNSFEHISNPEAAFIEALRLLKKDGYLYLSFSPLYYAPGGLHAYKSVGIPYVQFLFSENHLHSYIEKNKLPDISYTENNLNKWSLASFRNLWKKYAGQYELISYTEISDYKGLDLLTKYPSCFKSKSNEFDNFIYSGIELLIRKKA